jgi:hypothetical protein
MQRAEVDAIVLAPPLGARDFGMFQGRPAQGSHSGGESMGVQGTADKQDQ